MCGKLIRSIALGVCAMTGIVGADTTDAKFAADLYKRVSVKPGNVFVSPFGVRTALSMVAAGAGGRTARQLDDAIGEPPVKVGGGDDHWQYTLEIGNAVWGQRGLPYVPAFRKTLVEKFDATFEDVNFVADPEAARGRVNQWADDKTHGKIKDVLPEGSVHHLTRLVLADAIYFKARWNHEFPKGSTKPGPFHLADENSVDVPMMHGPVDHGGGYFKGEGFSVVSKDYVVGSARFVAVVPDSADGLAAVEKATTPESLGKWAGGLDRSAVVLTMPKFTFDWDGELSPACKAMGIVDAFDPGRADFSRMVGPTNEKLSIDGVFHKSFVAVDEEGTEAAAVTAIPVAGAMAQRDPRKPVEVVLDRPFVFLIVDGPTNQILFMGRVVDPRK